MLELARITAQPLELPTVDDRKEHGGALFKGQLGLIQGVKVRLSAVLGQAELTVADLFGLKEGSTLTLDRDVDAPVDLLLEGQVVARGRLVAVDDSFGISITEIAAAQA